MNVIKLIDVSHDPNIAQKLAVVTEDKLKLLSPQSHWVERAQSWNTRLLERLTLIDGNAARTLRDRTSCIDQVKVTMISPAPQHEAFDLRYDAMTYSWHRDSWKLADGLTAPDIRSSNGNEAAGNVHCPISQEMWKVVLSESAANENLLWIDQLCINQKDRDEKMFAVGFTDRIYQNAERVFIVLEDVSIAPAIVNDILQGIAAGKFDEGSNTQYLTSDFTQSACDFCLTLFSARVFSRSWCWHEFACSDRHVLLVPISMDTPGSGSQILRLEMNLLVRLIHITAVSIQNATEEHMIRLIPHAHNIGRALRCGEKLIKGQFNPTFPEAFRNTFRSSAKLKSDQMTITLNSCNTDLLFTGPEPDCEDDCYRILNSIAFAAGDPSIIGVTGKRTLNKSGSLSTWSMMPSNDEFRQGFLLMKPDSTSFNVQIDEEGALKINVIKLALVREVQQPDTNFVDIASAFLNQDFQGIYEIEPFVLDRRIHDEAGDHWQKGELRLRYINQKFFYAQALAILLQKGDEAFLNDLEDDRLLGPKIFDSSERTRLFMVLDWLRSCSGKISVQSLTQSRPQEVTDDDYAIVARFTHLFVTRILGVKDMYDLNKQDSWMSYTIGTLTSLNLSKTGLPIVVPRHFPDAVITVPADTASADYSLLRRVWILQSSDDVNLYGPVINKNTGAVRKYHLLAKTMLVGYQHVQKDDELEVIIH